MNLKANEAYEGVTFSKQDYSSSSLNDMTAEDCIFIDCDFSDVDFSYTRFSECKFENCNLSNIKLHDTALQMVNFQKCKIVGVDFSGGKPFLLEFGFDECRLEVCLFYDLNLSKMIFRESDIIECDFYNCILQESYFGKSTLSNSHFDKCDLRKSDFRLAKDYRIDQKNNQIKDAYFSMPEVLSFLKSLRIKIDY